MECITFKTEVGSLSRLGWHINDEQFYIADSEEILRVRVRWFDSDSEIVLPPQYRDAVISPYISNVLYKFSYCTSSDFDGLLLHDYIGQGKQYFITKHYRGPLKPICKITK
jgi:hypothetical protein